MKKYIAIVGVRCPDAAVDKLLALHEIEEVVKLPKDKNIAEPIADHPDSLICIFNDKIFVHSEYAKTAEKELYHLAKKSGLALCPTEAERAAVYPLDCGFNALSIPDHHLLIGRKKSLAEPLKNHAKGDTNQGYAGCSALYADGTVITADPSLEKAALKLGIPVFNISGKDISLPGYKEGFIGGAGGSFDRTICIFGNTEHSVSARKLASFCDERSMKLVCLEDGGMTDRGGIKFVPII